MEKQVAIVVAGVSDLLACKYVLRKGFEPIMFEADGRIGEVWVHTMESTKLQSIKQAYLFYDFLWPSSVKELYPSHTKVLEYLESYVHLFGIYPCIRFNSNVTSIDYVGESYEEIESWHLWGGKGMPLAPKGNGTLQCKMSKVASLSYVNFRNFWAINRRSWLMELIILLCNSGGGQLDRFTKLSSLFYALDNIADSGLPNNPELPPNQGPQVFNGQWQGDALHGLLGYGQLKC